MRYLSLTHKGVKHESKNYIFVRISNLPDVIELEARVENISKESCEELYTMYPIVSATEKRRCIKKAISSAEEQVQAAIVAAI